MARDDSPKKRQQYIHSRKQNNRSPCDRILIVSEGSKTEPNYFTGIRQAFRLQTANIEVQPSDKGTSPVQVVEYAKELFEMGNRHKGIQAGAFEWVYAVFDRDDHATYFDALRLAESWNLTLKNDNDENIIFEAIPSVPSFEIWLLLHYENIQSHLHRDEVMRRLRQHLPTYEKGAANIFDLTRQHLDIAVGRMRDLINKGCTATDDTTPYTGVAELVFLLTRLRAENNQKK